MTLRLALLMPGNFAGRFFQHFDTEALALAIAQIHALQHLRPVLRFGAAGAGLDVDEAIVGIHRIGEHAAEFHVRHGLFQSPMHRCRCSAA